MVADIKLQTAPLWINAFVYLLIGRLVHHSSSLACFTKYKISSWHISTSFILLDILAFAIQTAGIVMATLPQSSHEKVLRGVHLYMAGISLQLLFILLFSFVLWKLQQMLKEQAGDKTANKRVWVLYAVLLLVSVRIVFRLVEYSRGISSDISRQEVYVYVFDSVPMLVALWVFNLFHPGRGVQGQKLASEDV
jgi:hypothetical protein